MVQGSFFLQICLDLNHKCLFESRISNWPSWFQSKTLPTKPKISHDFEQKKSNYPKIIQLKKTLPTATQISSSHNNCINRPASQK